MKLNLRNETGITLISLIITVIIMVILATVAINSIYNMAIVDKATKGSQDYASESVKENQMMDSTVGVIDRTLKNIKLTQAEVKVGTSLTNDYKLSEKFSHGEYTWGDIEYIAKLISECNSVTKATQDRIEISMGEDTVTIAPGDTFTLKDTSNNSYTVRVLGFNTDKLVGDPYGNGKSYAGISFEFVTFLKYNNSSTTKQMNSTNTNENGWGASAMKADLNGANGVQKLENYNYIKTVQKNYNTGNQGTTTGTTGTGTIDGDKLWLLACSEIWANGYTTGAYGYCKTNESTMPEGITETRYAYYAIYAANDLYNTSPQEATKKLSTDSQSWWWLRSPCYVDSYGFCDVNGSGVCGGHIASNSYGVAPGFCI